MPTFKIDGKDVPFEPGDTILKAAYRAGIDIPYYCWHPGLSVAANCRMCLVEVLPAAGRLPMLLDVLELDKAAGKYIKTQKPKLQPACQVPVTENMQVLSDSSPHVLKARHAIQELLLLNHPVDCPICDQAGNCKLQDYWTKHMGSAKRMRDEIIHKPKAQSFGPTIMYDAERCILCTRCIRFCAQIAKDPVLSLRERGNLNEITISQGRQLDHPYSLMLEQVCPVGAMTAKHFRFKTRVWFLRSAKVVCQRCATGCNAWLDYDPRCRKAYRLRPRENSEVNTHWMCDEGMLSYMSIHDHRQTGASVDSKSVPVQHAVDKVASLLKSRPAEACAFVLNAQYSCEDNYALAQLGKAVGVSRWFMGAAPRGEGDSVLRSEDKNSNVNGVKLVAESLGIDLIESNHKLHDDLKSGAIQVVVMLGERFGDIQEEKPLAVQDKDVLVINLASSQSLISRYAHVVLPVCGWAEAQGLYVNRSGIGQHSEKALNPIQDALPAWKVVNQIAGSSGLDIHWSCVNQLRTTMRSSQLLEKVMLCAQLVEPVPHEPFERANLEPTDSEQIESTCQTAAHVMQGG